MWLCWVKLASVTATTGFNLHSHVGSYNSQSIKHGFGWNPQAQGPSWAGGGGEGKCLRSVLEHTCLRLPFEQMLGFEQSFFAGVCRGLRRWGSQDPAPELVVQTAQLALLLAQVSDGAQWEKLGLR